SVVFFFFSSRRRHTRFSRDWSSDVCSSDLTYHTGRVLVDPEVFKRVTGESFNAETVTVEALEQYVDETDAAVEKFNADLHGPERSEERRVGKEWRGGGAACPWKEKEKAGGR